MLLSQLLEKYCWYQIQIEWIFPKENASTLNILSFFFLYSVFVFCTRCLTNKDALYQIIALISTCCPCGRQVIKDKENTNKKKSVTLKVENTPRVSADSHVITFCLRFLKHFWCCVCTVDPLLTVFIYLETKLYIQHIRYIHRPTALQITVCNNRRWP